MQYFLKNCKKRLWSLFIRQRLQFKCFNMCKKSAISVCKSWCDGVCTFYPSNSKSFYTSDLKLAEALARSQTLVWSIILRRWNFRVPSRLHQQECHHKVRILGVLSCPLHHLSATLFVILCPQKKLYQHYCATSSGTHVVFALETIV